MAGSSAHPLTRSFACDTRALGLPEAVADRQSVTASWFEQRSAQADGVAV